MASHPIYQFYAELDDYKPKIWQRFQVTDDITVARLGYVLQVLFEMTASHLMAIEVPEGDNRRIVWKSQNTELPQGKFGDAIMMSDTIRRYEIPNEFEPFSDPHRNVLHNYI